MSSFLIKQALNVYQYYSSDFCHQMLPCKFSIIQTNTESILQAVVIAPIRNIYLSDQMVIISKLQYIQLRRMYSPILEFDRLKNTFKIDVSDFCTTAKKRIPKSGRKQPTISKIKEGRRPGFSGKPSAHEPLATLGLFRGYEAPCSCLHRGFLTVLDRVPLKV